MITIIFKPYLASKAHNMCLLPIFCYIDTMILLLQLLSYFVISACLTRSTITKKRKVRARFPSVSQTGRDFLDYCIHLDMLFKMRCLDPVDLDVESRINIRPLDGQFLDPLHVSGRSVVISPRTHLQAQKYDRSTVWTPESWLQVRHGHDSALECVFIIAWNIFSQKDVPRDRRPFRLRILLQ